MAGTSSLLKSAAAVRAKIQSQQDAEIAFDYSNSTKTYDQFLQYSKYLQDRAAIASDPSDQLTYAKTIKSAQSGYISNEIQRTTQSVMEGRAPLEEKQGTIEKLWQQAVDIGNYDQALSLQSSWDNLSVQIQNRNDAAVQAQQALSNAQEAYSNKVEAYNKRVATAQGGAYSDLAHSIQGGLEELTRAYSQGGQVAYNKAAKDFVDSHRDALKELGIDIPKDYSTNIGQLMEGMVKGIANYYALASQATAIDNPDASQRYKESLQDIVTGKTKFSSPTGGQLSASQVSQFAKTPNKYLEYVDPKTGETQLKPSTVAGYRIDENGNLVKDYSGVLKATAPKNDKDLKKQLEKMGFGNVTYDESSGTYVAQLTPETEKWLNSESIGRTKGATIPLTYGAGGFQYLSSDNKLYSLATDKKGLGGLFEVDPVSGLKHVSGQYGFDQNNNTAKAGINSILAPRKWVAPMQTTQQVDQKASGGQIPVFNNAPTIGVGAAQNALAVINKAKAAPQMVQRAGGGFNYIGSNGQPISAYSYALQTGQSFRTVLSQAAAKGDTYSAQALKYAGNDGAYNPAQVDVGTAKNWSSLTWGNNVNLQTPQAARVSGVSMPSQVKIPLFNQGF